MATANILEEDDKLRASVVEEERAKAKLLIDKEVAAAKMLLDEERDQLRYGGVTNYCCIYCIVFEIMVVV